jgi:hypothetical protein
VPDRAVPDRAGQHRMRGAQFGHDSGERAFVWYPAPCCPTAIPIATGVTTAIPVRNAAPHGIGAGFGRGSSPTHPSAGVLISTA